MPHQNQCHPSVVETTILFRVAKVGHLSFPLFNQGGSWGPDAHCRPTGKYWSWCEGGDKLQTTPSFCYYHVLLKLALARSTTGLGSIFVFLQMRDKKKTRLLPRAFNRGTVSNAPAGRRRPFLWTEICRILPVNGRDSRPKASLPRPQPIRRENIE